MKIKSRFLRKMIINKMLLVAIPILMLICFLAASFYSLNTSRVEELQSRVLQENVKTFEDRYYDLQVMASRMSGDTSVYEANFAPNDISYPVLDFMRKTMLPRTFYSEFLFFPRVNEYIYTASYTTSAKRDFKEGNNKSFLFESTGNAAVLEYAEAGEERVLPEQNICISGRMYRGIAIIVPLSRESAGSLVAVVASETIGALFGGAEEGKYGTALYLGEEEIFDDGDISAVGFHNSSFVYGNVVRQKTGNMFYFGTRTYFSELSVVRAYSGSTWQNTGMLLFILCLIILLCVAWIVTFIVISIRTEYKPIKNISVNLQKFLGDSGVAVPIAVQQSEIDAVNGMIEILRNLREAPEVAEEEEKVAGSRALYDYLTKAAETFEFGENRAFFSVLLLIAPSLDGNDGALMRELTATEQEISAEYASWRDQIMLAVAYDKNKSMNSYIAELSARLGERCGEEGYRLVIGTVGGSVEDLHKSFFDAEVARNYMESRNMGGALYSDFVFDDSAYRNKQVIELLSRLDYHFKLRDARGLDQALGDVEEFISSPETSPDYCKTVFLFVKNNFLHEFHYSAATSDDGAVNRILDIEIKDVGVMLTMLKVIRTNLHKIFPAKSQEGMGLDKESVGAYIDGHFLDADFSLNTIAEQFGNSPSNFSRTFKTMFGVNFKAYVDTKKMWEAKRLLSETDLTVEEISVRLNYSNASNFLRAFKSQFLISPGQYRKKNEEGGK